MREKFSAVILRLPQHCFRQVGYGRVIFEIVQAKSHQQLTSTINVFLSFDVWFLNWNAAWNSVKHDLGILYMCKPTLFLRNLLDHKCLFLKNFNSEYIKRLHTNDWGSRGNRFRLVHSYASAGIITGRFISEIVSITLATTIAELIATARSGIIVPSWNISSTITDFLL